MQDAANFEYDHQQDQEAREEPLNHKAIQRCQKWIMLTRMRYRSWSPMNDEMLLEALGIDHWNDFDWMASDAFEAASKKLNSWLDWQEENPEDPSGGISQDDLPDF